VTGHDTVLAIDQDGIGPTVLNDTRGDFGDLRI
jgi:hypothetical protein